MTTNRLAAEFITSGTAALPNGLVLTADGEDLVIERAGSSRRESWGSVKATVARVESLIEAAQR